MWLVFKVPHSPGAVGSWVSTDSSHPVFCRLYLPLYPHIDWIPYEQNPFSAYSFRVPSVLLIGKNRACEKTSFEEVHVQSSRARSLNFAAYIWRGWLFLPAVIKAWPRARLPTPAQPWSPWDLVDGGGGGEDLPALRPGCSERRQLGCLCGLCTGRIPIIILRTSTPSCERGKLHPVVGRNLIQPDLLYSLLDCFSHDICYFSVHEGCFLCSLPCPQPGVWSPVKSSVCSRIASELGLRSQHEPGTDAERI